MDDYINKKFKFYVPVTKSKDAPDDGRLYLDGVASTTSKDYEDDQMEPEAIESMKKQALAGLPGFDGHNYGLDGIFGKIVAVKDTNSNVFHPIFRVRKSMEAKINELLDDGIKLGLSIGGMVKDFSFKGSTRLIKDLLLFEVSLTPIPVVADTLGTVGVSDYQPSKKAGCSGGICHQIFKSIDDKYFKKSDGYQVNSACYTLAMGQVKAGTYNSTDSWTFNDASDGGELLGKDNNFTRYSKAFLAVDKNKDLQTKGAYHFPIAKTVNGKVVVFRSGVAAASKAAGGARSGVAHNNVSDACSKILAAMDKKEKMFKGKEDKTMDDEKLKEFIDDLKESNRELVEGLKEAITPPAPEAPPEGPEAEGVEGEKSNEPEFTKEQLIEDAKAALIKELSPVEEEPAEDPNKEVYNEVVKGLVKDVLEGVKKARVHERKPDDSNTEDNDAPTKKTQTIDEAAAKLAKQTQLPNIAR